VAIVIKGEESHQGISWRGGRGRRLGEEGPYINLAIDPRSVKDVTQRTFTKSCLEGSRENPVTSSTTKPLDHRPALNPAEVVGEGGEKTRVPCEAGEGNKNQPTYERAWEINFRSSGGEESWGRLFL